MSKSRKKQKKTKDLARCCQKCNFCTRTPLKKQVCEKNNKEDSNSSSSSSSVVVSEMQFICSLDAVEVYPDSVCPRFNQQLEAHCQHCGKILKFSDWTDLAASVTKLRFEDCSGNTMQNFTICQNCSQEAREKFEKLLAWMMKHDRR